MKLRRLSIGGLTAVALVAAGCSSNGSTSGSTSTPTPTSSTTAQASSPTTTASAPAGSPDASTCLDIGLAKDNLMLAGDAAAARTNADTLEKYNPPDPVKSAIEHFVTTLGVQPNDPDLDANRNQVTAWVKQICPNVN